MPEQTALPLWPRDYDLPPLWDGLPVEWGEWRDTADIFICPPPPKRPKCERCGSRRDPRMSLGRVFTELVMVKSTRKSRLANGKHLVAHLSALRCPDCEHDYVFDFTNDQAWDLDPSDYTADGSWDVQEATDG